MDRILQQLMNVLCTAPVAIISLTVHEYSHARAAYRLGDSTAKLAGRLSLNPLRHISWPGFLAMLIFRFGWAKPVPFTVGNLRDPKRGISKIALAGPISNLLLAAVFFVLTLIYLVASYFLPGWLSGAMEIVELILVSGLMLNISLAVFNLLPISPLDGSKIFASVLPDKAYYTVLRYEQYGFIVLIFLMATGILSKPAIFVTDKLLDLLVFLANTILRAIL